MFMKKSARHHPALKRKGLPFWKSFSFSNHSIKEWLYLCQLYLFGALFSASFAPSPALLPKAPPAAAPAMVPRAPRREPTAAPATAPTPVPTASLVSLSTRLRSFLSAIHFTSSFIIIG